MSSIGFWTGATGLRAYQNKMDVIGHNIANVQTNGYKARRAAFDDLLRSRINTNVEGNHLVGHGVKQEYVDNLMNQGQLSETGQALDFAIVGEGFFCVDDGGERQYTRNGAFYLSVEGNGASLVTNDGAYVLDKNGQRITLSLNADGTANTDELGDRLGVWGFDNQFGLESQNNARYTVSENSGAAVLLGQGAANARTYELKQAYLELSTVQLSNEMVEMINAQRAFQANSRVVQTNDQIAEELNNLR